ncbi:hypothetical protein B9479_006260 [Cryptococcus floricola]|uniref:Uncharacterized protein n=1 Tax=Cryptococcus floricola TaxID=2591691 RepID=A0A5D3ANP4_9TREE|nr:hypothetical protein B9479_006260 [Cryptococcus floricola]
MTHDDSSSPSLGGFAEEVYNKVLLNKALQQEAVIHREDTDGHITRDSQLEATLANFSNLQEQEARRNQEFTNGLVNRVSQLETTLANITLQKTPPDIHVNVQMPPQQSSSTTAGDAPPRLLFVSETEPGLGRTPSAVYYRPFCFEGRYHENLQRSEEHQSVRSICLSRQDL